MRRYAAYLLNTGNVFKGCWGIAFQPWKPSSVFISLPLLGFYEESPPVKGKWMLRLATHPFLPPTTQNRTSSTSSFLGSLSLCWPLRKGKAPCWEVCAGVRREQGRW